MEVDEVLRLSAAYPHNEELDCNVTNIASSVANLARRSSLKAFISGFG